VNNRLGRRLERFLEPRTVNRFVAVSDAVRKDWQTYLEALGVPPTRVQVIYSGVSVETFAAPGSQSVERLRTELGIGAGPVLISAARFHRGKNLHILPAVVEQLKTKHPDVQLLLAGWGDEEASLRSLVTNMGLDDSVQFLGLRTDLSDLFAVSDVFLFPSGEEGFGLVVLEALAAGLPVVTTRLPSLQKLWSRKVGIELANSITPGAFADAVDGVLSQPQEARANAAVGQNVVRTEWSASASAAKYLEVYREIVGEMPGSRE
jgi:glycosyltransferase involved in cell wall biosynthesis